MEMEDHLSGPMRFPFTKKRKNFVLGVSANQLGFQKRMFAVRIPREYFSYDKRQEQSKNDNSGSKQTHQQRRMYFCPRNYGGCDAF